MTEAGAGNTQKKPSVFVSYSSKDRERIGVLAKALEESGLTVWWDHALNPGEDYRQKIEAALASADAVVVCWSDNSAKSDFVISEADDARKRLRLVPVLIGPCKLPKPFDVLHTADLAKWKGARAAPAFQTVVETIRAKAEGRDPKTTAWRSRLWTAGGVGLVIGAVFAAAPAGAAFWSVYNTITAPRAATAAEMGETVEDAVARAFDRLIAQTGRPQNADAEEQLTANFTKLSARADPAASRAWDILAPGGTAATADATIANLEGVAADASAPLATRLSVLKLVGGLLAPKQPEKALDAYHRAIALAPTDLDAQGQYLSILERTGENDTARAAALQLIEGAATNDLKALGHRMLGILALRAGQPDDFVEAKAQFETARGLSHNSGNQKAEAAALSQLGVVARRQGLQNEAEERLNNALAINTRIGNRIGEAGNLVNLAIAAIEERKALAIARIYLEKAEQIAKESGNQASIADVNRNLGLLARRDEKYDEATISLEAALKFDEASNFVRGQAIAHADLGRIALTCHDLARARSHFSSALALYSDPAVPQSMANQNINLGEVALLEGKFDEAAARAAEALRLYESPKGRTQAAELMMRIETARAQTTTPEVTIPETCPVPR